MNIAVIGAGVVGTATAWELTADGHEVTLYDRHPTVGEEASFAPGALIGPGWNAPWLPNQSKWSGPWGKANVGLHLQRLPRLAEWSWLWRWAKCAKGRANTPQQEALQRMALYSAEHTHDLNRALELNHDATDGLLVVLRSPQEAEWVHGAIDPLRAIGVALQLFTPDQARDQEPALNPETPLHAAVAITGAGAANCREWTLLMKARTQKLGAQLTLGTLVSRLEPIGNGAWRVHTPDAPQPFADHDSVVLCTGASAPALLRPLGLKPPIQTITSHSVSAAIREPLDAPLSAVFDPAQQVSIARLGQRVRLSGGALLGARPGLTPDPAALKHLYRTLMDWFPGAARFGGPQGSVQEWRSSTAATHDSLPLVGGTRLPGLWLNLGHGTAGWTLAAGSARLLADEMRGASPSLDATAYSPQRLGL